jgi:hypothetical protein
MNARTYVDENGKKILQELKARFPIYHLSNVFFRDIQYGIQSLLEEKGMKVRYPEAERLAGEFVESMERQQIFVPIDEQTWVVRLEDFKTPTVQKTPAKPSADRPAAPSTARPAPEPARTSVKDS